ncbi:four helix bundle protein [Bacillus sp. PS06]|uniref:four helix bundle protein n=1 Tax=Bacillus sp. PS06 TaxID=2764176 RepID=UPI0017857E8B|nr:four helix bundle protein [Bacillus sp. PS06]MBD8069759.1 four helix bundle protein [Bacillus sp. PS06]
MNQVITQIQQKYRENRELKNYSIFDIDISLKELADRGLIWVLKDLKDMSDGEKILIDHYLNEYRANQIYDNLDGIPYLQPSNESATTPLNQYSLNPVPVKKEKQTKKQQHLDVRDVKQFIGYKKAKELEEKIIELCKSFPSYEKKHVIDQIHRSAKSIKERIAIGEQIYIGEKFSQYSMSIGSAKETSAWLQISLGQKYITQEQYDDLDCLVNQVVSILTKTLCHLKDNEGKGIDLPNPYTPNVNNFGAYKNALLLVERIYEITRQREYWREKDLLYGMRQCSTSCVANIAEAHQLYIPKKFRFFNDSLKALQGLDSLLETSLNKGIISKETLKEIDGLRFSIRNVLTTKMSNISDEKAS